MFDLSQHSAGDGFEEQALPQLNRQEADSPRVRRDFNTGDFNTRHFHAGRFEILLKMQSEYLELPRDIAIYLPAEYHRDPTKKYPVLYLHDGQNLFDSLPTNGGFGGKWGVDQALDQLIEAGEIEPCIAVGIFNTADRNSEYCHVADLEITDTPLGEAYSEFIAKELKPLIDREYRTLSEREHTAICGSSLGAHISLYLAYRYPDLFGGVGALSASTVSAGNSDLQKLFSESPKFNARIWVDMGDTESSHGDPAQRAAISAEGVRFAEELIAVLSEKCEKLEGGIIAGGKHTESHWRGRFPDVARFLFSARIQSS